MLPPSDVSTPAMHPDPVNDGQTGWSGVPCDPLSAIEPFLVCPACRVPLRRAGDELVGIVCHHRYPIRDGIARLAILGGSETWDESGPAAGSADYQHSYQRVAAAEGYNRGYQTKLLKRVNTRRELALLRRLLRTQGSSRRLLNLPCGGGRVSRPLAESTGLLVEADIAVGQLLYGADRRDWKTPEVRMTASAFHIPLRDRAVDGVVCIRLCHHLPTPAERERLLTELFRVAERFVVMTFFDFRSVKNLLRRARRPLDRKPPKHTMRTGDVRRLAAANAFALHTAPYLSFFGSGHRYALFVREPAA
jgi:SAM-dependent methyltransferase